VSERPKLVLAAFARDSLNHEGGFIFILAMLTVAGEIFSDTVLTTGQISPAAPDPATAAVGRTAKPG
jgi:hypothetical protein